MASSSVGAIILATLLAAPATAEGAADRTRGETVTVTGWTGAATEQPGSQEMRTIEQIRPTTAVVGSEDTLRYLPDVLVSKRHAGDAWASLMTRTSGFQSSARSLVYVDGVLMSALIGNDGGYAAPKWAMAAPAEISAVTMSYGPFSAAYAGNSIGGVVEIETLIPKDFEAGFNLSGSAHKFAQYATKGDYGSWQATGEIGDRFGPFAFWASATHSESDSQPLSYVTANQPICTPTNMSGCAAPSAAMVGGAFADVGPTGAPILVLGAGGLEHTEQDEIKLKLGWDISDDVRLIYAVGRFANETLSEAETYLENASGAAVWAGGPYNVDGLAYAISASAFSEGVYDFQEEQWSHSLSLQGGDSDGVFQWRAVASLYDYATSEQRSPSGALPSAFDGGAGSITRMDGTGWETLDLEGVWRPGGRDGAHEVSFGAHGDRYRLANTRYAAADWRMGAAGAVAGDSRGVTETLALWAQEAWRINDRLKLTAGGRWEWWEASDGYNFSSLTGAGIDQPGLKADAFSPKASLEWEVADDWTVEASAGKAYRFPTVGELYQTVSAGPMLAAPNPRLRPETALSTEVSVTRHFEDGKIRLSAFTEDLDYALITQTAPLAGSSRLSSFVQNIEKVETRGLEIVADRDDVFIKGLSLWGNITYVESLIEESAGVPDAEGKRTPQVPEWRSTVTATYKPNDRWSFTLAGRYVDDAYGTIDNVDTVSHAYGGYEGFMTWDVRAAYTFDEHWMLAIGVENLNDADYFQFNPFPQRTVTAELDYRF